MNRNRHVHRSMLCFSMGFCLLIACRGPASGERRDMTDAIESILLSQKAAWNRGDVEGFMDGYLASDDLTFQSNGGRLRGWRTLLERYKTNYPGEKMGVLDFQDIEINPLSKDAAYVTGRYIVRTENASGEGLFTLIVRRIDGDWKIVHDHTSSDPNENR